MLDTIWEADFEISIHVPREGDDNGHPPGQRLQRGFQSTSPVRGTTLPRGTFHGMVGHFNPRPP